MDKLEHLSVIKVSGDDAGEFLQGQMTQDIRALEDGKIHMTSFCNVQGRVIASAFIQCENDHYDLILSSELADDLKNHLQRYILRSKVTIEKSEEMVFGIFKKDNVSDQQFFKPLSNDLERMLILANQAPENIDNFITSEEWIQCDINKMIPIITKESSVKFIPQMLNLDILDAVSFSKGCYTGQEVIARVQHRGKAKQRLYRIEAQTDKLFTPKDEIEQMGNKVGNVVISSLSENICDGLGVIKISAAGENLSIKGAELKIK